MIATICYIQLIDCWGLKQVSCKGSLVNEQSWYLINNFVWSWVDSAYWTSFVSGARRTNSPFSEYWNQYPKTEKVKRTLIYYNSFLSFFLFFVFIIFSSCFIFFFFFYWNQWYVYSVNHPLGFKGSVFAWNFVSMVPEISEVHVTITINCTRLKS